MENRKITGLRGSPENENHADQEDVVLGAEQAEEEAILSSFNPNRSQSPTFVGGNDEEGLDMYSPLLLKDEKHPDYHKLIEEGEMIVEDSDEQTLVRLMSQKEIHHTILRRVFEKWRVTERSVSPDFKKLANALAEWEDINGKVQNYDLSEELTEKLKDKEPARYYSVLKKAELIFKGRPVRPYEDLTNEELVEAANDPKTPAQEITRLSRESTLRQKEGKNKTAKDIMEMVKNGELHRSILENLAQEYDLGRDFGREMPDEGKEKIEYVFQQLGIKHKPLN